MKLRLLLPALVISLCLADSLHATAITYNPAPTTDTGWRTCSSVLEPGLAGANCRTTAFFEAIGLRQEWVNNPGGIGVIFGAAFNAWNTNAWTLALSNADPGGTFNVSIAMAEQFNVANNVVNNNVVRGGLEIQVSLSDALRTTMVGLLGVGDKLVWVQGLNDNYDLNGNIVAGFYEIDVTPANNPDPSYTDSFPPQPANNGFYDQPKFRYKPPDSVQGFFYANAYLAIENVAAKKLTVYDGIDYGWNNYVAAPEPQTWLLLCVGMLGIFGFGRRRRLRRVL